MEKIHIGKNWLNDMQMEDLCAIVRKHTIQTAVKLVFMSMEGGSTAQTYQHVNTGAVQI